MPITFTCPHCGRQTNVADQYAGQSGPCAGCGQKITVPGPGPSPILQPDYAPPAKTSGGGGVAIVAIVIACLFGLLVCGGILVAPLLVSGKGAREAARRTQCMNHLKQIALAFHNYHDVYKTFPPAYIPDENGQPKHSWRVLILPFLECQHIYNQYNFDEPWNSPNNLAVTRQPVPVYTCPSSPAGPGSTETNYMVITGPSTVFDAGKACTFPEILDGTANTVMVVEVAGTGVNWGEPKDLDASTLTYPLGTPGGSTPGSHHPGGLNVAMCDGSVRFVADAVSPQVFNAMITKAGAEAIPPGY